MGLLISKNDFVATYALSKQIEDSIDAYIDRYEKKYLVDMLGVELYKLFAADVNPVTKKPVTQIYLGLYNEIAEDYNNYIMRSEGMKSILLGFIWFEYVRATAYKHTPSGVVRMAVELSDSATWGDGFIQDKYNKSVNNYDVVQWYICENSTDYETYNGIGKSKINPFL